MNDQRINAFFSAFGTRVIIRFRFVCLVLVILAVLAGFTGTQRLAFDSSNESFFPESDDLVLLNQHFQEVFGNDDFVFVLVEADDVFSHEALTYIRSLSDDLKTNLPFVDDIVSLTNVEYLEIVDGTLYVRNLVDDKIPEAERELAEIRRKALAKPIYRNRILTGDGRNAGILIGIDRIPDYVYLAVEKGFSPLDQDGWRAEDVILADRIFVENQAPGEKARSLTKVSDPRKLIAPALRVILDRNRREGFRVTATGIPVLDFEIDRIAEQEGTRFGIVALIVSVGLMLALFRNLTGVIGPCLVVVSTLVILYGTMGWIGYPITLMSTVVSTLILVISVSYSIHVVHHLQDGLRRTGSRSESLKYAYFHSGWPCFLTAVTTAVGFASFLLVPIKPIRELGFLCALGVFTVYVLVMVLVPIVFSFGRAGRNVPPEKETKSGETVVSKLAVAVTGRPVLIIVSALAVVSVLAVFTFRVQVDSDFLKILGNDISFVRDCRHITETLGGLYSYEVMIELPQNGAAKSPDVLEAVDTITKRIQTWDSTVVTYSVVDLLKEIHSTMSSLGDGVPGIPQSRDLVAQYYLLYEISGGKTLTGLMDYDYRILRISVQVRDSSTALSRRFDEIRRLGGRLFPSGTRISVVGEVPLMMKMVTLLSFGQLKSVLAAFGVITLMMICILGTLRVGLLSMIPNAFPVVVIGGIMGMARIPLDMVTVMVMPMIIGIAVDDTIHYILHFKQEFHQCGRYRDANRRTFQKVGRAILFTSVILAVGFLILTLSQMKSLTSMAVLSCAGIVSALAADLLITPVLFVLLRPFGEEKQATGDSGVCES